MKNIFLGALLALGVCAFPAEMRAFDVLDTKAVRVDARTALFTITYEFGFLNANLWMSPGAKEMGGEKEYQETYIIVDAKGDRIQSNNIGTVLSTATLERTSNSHMYFVPQKERASFTLMVLAQSDTAFPEGTSLKVTSLPFVLQKSGEQRILQEVTGLPLAGYTATLK